MIHTFADLVRFDNVQPKINRFHTKSAEYAAIFTCERTVQYMSLAACCTIAWLQVPQNATVVCHFKGEYKASSYNAVCGGGVSVTLAATCN